MRPVSSALVRTIFQVLGKIRYKEQAIGGINRINIRSQFSTDHTTLVPYAVGGFHADLDSSVSFVKIWTGLRSCFQLLLETANPAEEPILTIIFLLLKTHAQSGDQTVRK